MVDDTLEHEIAVALADDDAIALERLLVAAPTASIIDVLERAAQADRAIVYRMLQRDQALEIFESLDSGLRADLLAGLSSDKVLDFFERIDPDDRATVIDELPAGVVRRLMGSLSPAERELTAPMLGYARSAVGRWMTPEVVRIPEDATVRSALARVRERGSDASTLDVLLVTTPTRRLTGVVSLRDLVLGDADQPVAELMKAPVRARATDNAESTARRCLDAGLTGIPILDNEDRLLGLLTADDASRIVSAADDEDTSRSGGTEPLRRPYLSASLVQVVRSRIVWLLVLAVSALLTVQVLEMFEGSLEQVATLALFIPLLTGTAGNTGSQAAVTVTRALATGDLRIRDFARVISREMRVGFMLGLVLGLLALALGTAVYGVTFGGILALTLVAICTTAAVVGGAMPIIASRLGVDPAVFSTPFITTFCDATGLLIYFTIATSLLNL